jgi:hypothetical protein
MMIPAASHPEDAAKPDDRAHEREAVFATAHLVWLDLESGDELSIELSGPRPFLEDLMAQGFALLDVRAAEADITGGVAGRAEARIATS